MNINVTNNSRIDNSNYTAKSDVVKKNENIDDNGKTLSQDLGKDVFEKSTNDDLNNLTYKPVKNKLTSEEIKALKEVQANSEKEFVRNFISNTINTQNKLFSSTNDNGLSKETTDLLTKIFGSIEKAYPKVGTTPEEAQKAISDGGAYSVGTVADRIMTMATALAGNDSNKLEQMRDAVEKGFSQAGIDFKNSTKMDDLPQISKDTYTEVMKRFDALQNKTADTKNTSVNQQENKTTKDN